MPIPPFLRDLHARVGAAPLLLVDATSVRAAVRAGEALEPRRFARHATPPIRYLDERRADLVVPSADDDPGFVRDAARPPDAARRSPRR